ncbi:hypothetical protein GCM10022381_10870 [Leifsonia kafniensis]|uniref:M23ase beta-sheet core domain-containing protein n=2 Tax=Leifsonia kafniensis TaxID=475957 RepID=A0ABP7K8M2_9MICO
MTRFAVIVILVPLGAGVAAGAPLAREPVGTELRAPPVYAPPVYAPPVYSPPVYSPHFVRLDMTDDWEWPRGLPIEVSGPFIAPLTPYATGHRGIDLAAAPGTAVLAPFDGTISYAGVVVDRPVIAIDHAGDLRSSFEPVEATVAVGDRVSTGQQIGTVTVGGHCSPGCFHFGVRLHGQYLSPLVLLGGVPRAVLLPRVPK